MRVACYTRVSTEEQARHGISLDAQKAALTAFAAENHYTVVDFYTDEGISARKPVSKRPELQRLLADVQERKVDLILFCKLDRWTRNVREYHKCQEVLERFNVPWRAIQEDYETETAAGRFKVNIMLAVAEDEADRTSERIKAVFEQKRVKKEALTGNCPTGYRLEGKKLVKDEAVQNAVSAFFSRYLETASIWEAQQAAAGHGLSLQYQLARKMLRSTCYYGLYYGVEDMCEPYITKAQYDLIQEAFPRRIKHNAKYFYILSGLVVCGSCGRRMGGKSSRRTSQHYNCVSHYADRICPNGVNISESVLEKLLLERVGPLMASAAPQEQADTTEGIRSEIAALKSKIGRLADLYLNDMITMEDLKLRRAQYETEIAALQKKLPKDIRRVDLQLGWQDMYKVLSPEEKRHFWRLLLDKIIVYPDRTVDIVLR